MEIRFRKLSDRRHRVTVLRGDGTSDTVELDSKDFLRHDLAHLAVELEVGLRHGVWGSVAGGGTLDGVGLDGADMSLAERLAGPVQTLMRTGAGPEEIGAVLQRLAPDVAGGDLAQRLHGRLRAFAGHWAGTGYGEDMVLDWPFG